MALERLVRCVRSPGNVMLPSGRHFEWAGRQSGRQTEAAFELKVTGSDDFATESKVANDVKDAHLLGQVTSHCQRCHTHTQYWCDSHLAPNKDE